MRTIKIYNPVSQSLKDVNQNGELEDLNSSEIAELNQLILNTNACQVLSAEMPVKQARQIVKALPFALEEQLANEIDDNHIHYLGKDAGLAYALLVEHTFIESVVSEYNPDTLCYLPLLLPYSDKQVTICLLDGIASVRHSEFGAASVSPEILPLLLERLKTDERSTIDLYDFDQSNELLVLEFENLGYDVNVSDNSSLLEHLDNQLLKQVNNLRSGIYQKKKAKAETKFTKLKAPLALAASVLLVVFIVQLKEMKQYEQMGNLVSTASKDFYKTLFPEERIRSIRRQFNEKLEDADGISTGGSGFIHILGSASKDISLSGNVEWDAVRYTGKKNELELNLIVSNIAQLDSIKKKLTENGLQVDIASATETGSKIKGVLKVKQNG